MSTSGVSLRFVRCCVVVVGTTGIGSGVCFGRVRLVGMFFGVVVVVSVLALVLCWYLVSGFLATGLPDWRLGIRLPRPNEVLELDFGTLARGELLLEVEDEVCNDSGGVGDATELDAEELVTVATLEACSVLSHSLSFRVVTVVFPAAAVGVPPPAVVAFSEGSSRRSKKEMMLKLPLGESLFSPLSFDVRPAFAF